MTDITNRSRRGADSAPPPTTTRPARVFGVFPLALGFFAGILLCAGVAVALSVLRGQPAPQRLPSAEPAARAICTALTGRDYAALYDLLSAEQRAAGSVAQFSASQHQLDIAAGPVQRCDIAVAHAESGQATVTFTVARGSGPAKSGMARMLFEQGAWRLDTYDAQVV